MPSRLIPLRRDRTFSAFRGMPRFGRGSPCELQNAQMRFDARVASRELRRYPERRSR